MIFVLRIANSHFGLLFRLYYRYDVNNQCTTTICTYRVHSEQLFPITHSSTGIFAHFGCSFLHVFQGAFLRSNPWCSSWAHEQPKSLLLGAVRHAVKEFTHRVYLVIDLDTALVAISCEHQNLARTVTVPFWDCRRRSRVPFTPFVNAHQPFVRPRSRSTSPSSISEEIVQSMAATQPKKADPRNANWLLVVRISN